MLGCSEWRINMLTSTKFCMCTYRQNLVKTWSHMIVMASFNLKFVSTMFFLNILFTLHQKCRYITA
jgi:hypothetical protein